MNTRPLPAKISSLFGFLWLLCVIALVLFTLFGMLFATQARAGTIDYGRPAKKYYGILTVVPDPVETYDAEYQQVFDGTLFGRAGYITQIAFMSATSGFAVDATYHLSLSLGLTTKKPGTPDDSLASGLTPIFSGALPVHFTALAIDYDLTINLPTPFYYDPKKGNLVVDIVRPGVPLFQGYGYSGKAVAGVVSFCGESPTNYMESISATTDRLAGGPAFVDATPYDGLVTRFTTSPVPEPGMGGLLFLGAALCGSRRRGKAH